MATHKLIREPKNTLRINITIPWSEIEDKRKKVIESSVEDVAIKGFRKGKAPVNLVEEAMGEEKILNETLKDLIPEIYAQAVKEYELKPILLPQIHIDKGDKNADWELHAITCEAPEVILGDYKAKLKGEMASNSIWTPQKQTEEKSEEIKREERLNKIIEWLIANIPVEASDMLVSEEANHMLTRLFDQLQKLGLTVDQYLASKGKTAEGLRGEFAKSAKDNLCLEFILSAIASEENTRPTEEEVQKWIDGADPQTQELLKQEESQLSLRSALTRRKTLDFLLTLS